MYLQASVIFCGEVQGVSFRSTIRKHATDSGVTGWVKNLKDGSVEALFIGEKTTIEQLLEKIKNQSGFARITNLEIQYQKKQKNYSGFEIIF